MDWPQQFPMINPVPSQRAPRARHATIDLTRHRGRTALCVVLAVVLFIGSFVGFALRDLQDQVTRVDVRSLVGTARPTRADNTPIPDDYAGVAVNILVLGTDSRAGANDIDGEGGKEITSARSDTAMVMHVSADRSRIDVVSIPRDTLVPIPSCTQASGAQTWAQSSAMFNSAFSNGAGEGNDSAAVAAGAACTIKTVEALTKLHIDEYMVVDFTGLQHMVDSLGGVTIYNDEDIDDSKHTGLVLPVGCHVLDGATALKYARARYGAGDGSDISRIGRQQNLMAAMLRTAQSKNLLTNADDLYSFARSSLATLTTSPGIGSLTTLAGLAQSLKSIGMANVHFVTMPVVPAPGDANRRVAAYNADEVWQALINDQPVPDETVSLNATGATPTPSDASGDTGSSDSGSTDAGSTTADGTGSGSTDSGSATAPAAELSPAEQCYAQSH